jgi:uncharacterized protein YkwD
MGRPHSGPQKGIGGWPGTSSDGSSLEDRHCLELVNEFRKANGKSSLGYSRVLSDVAMPHTQAMLAGKVALGHAGFQERTEKVPYAMGTGENVAYCEGFDDPVKVMVDGWIKSPGHRRNLLGEFNAMGTAFVHRGDLWYGTQFFGNMPP